MEPVGLTLTDGNVYIDEESLIDGIASIDGEAPTDGKFNSGDGTISPIFFLARPNCWLK